MHLSLRVEYLHELFRITLHGGFISSSPFTYLYISIDSWVDKISVLHSETTNSGILGPFDHTCHFVGSE